MARIKDEDPHPVDRHVGRRVQEKRLGLGLTQTALAKAVGVSFQQVQKYEKGTNRVSASKLFEIADFMKVDIPFFFEGFAVAQPGSAKRRPPPSITNGRRPNTPSRSTIWCAVCRPANRS